MSFGKRRIRREDGHGHRVYASLERTTLSAAGGRAKEPTVCH
jgi:hypothetical protein